jgi:hypothetical protein
MVTSGNAGDVLRPCWQVEMDNGAWMDYTDEESHLLDDRMMAGEASFRMTAHKWRHYVFVLDSSFDDLEGEHGEMSEYRMYQYNTQSNKKRRIRRIIVLLDY